MGIWSDWFGAKSASAEGGMHLPPWLQGVERDGGYACSYEERLREVYRSNPVGLRSVRLVAGAVGGLTLFSNRTEALAIVSAPGLMERIAAALLFARPPRALFHCGDGLGPALCQRDRCFLEGHVGTDDPEVVRHQQRERRPDGAKKIRNIVGKEGAHDPAKRVKQPRRRPRFQLSVHVGRHCLQPGEIPRLRRRHRLPAPRDGDACGHCVSSHGRRWRVDRDG